MQQLPESDRNRARARLELLQPEWLWFEPMAHVAIWQGPDAQHGFHADSLDEALECIERQAMG
ncbi:MAG: hypothetical protein KDJ28_03760 [Candidatus Competibacteraceae bacterium]|nr:hypothetical protein [Candidatus Competibacteraceae bacterium]